ncbi:CBS domain-containing protein [Sphingomonas sp. BE138]|uniref:CBS domain-containing protein n=1 Tax=Sphingomonas sp. BE138 TaxID=2817845 RepID=UPI002855D660|nr:CBS domain-containing protein [Sphingomonas sp. BE138]MDR6788933.1 CBS domain-containing protein [Sphingomonas sp. BE138]
MTIAAIIGRKGSDTIAVAPDTPLGTVVALLAEHRIGAVPVVDGGAVHGIFSERDVIRLLAKGDAAQLLGITVGELMTREPLTVTRDDSVLAALSLMTHRRIRHLPVVEHGVLIGIVSIGDLVKYRIDRIEADASAMRDYIQQA